MAALSGMLPYPLLCSPDAGILPCFAAGGWIPHAVCHLFTFYLGFAFVAMGRRRGIVWSDQSFKKAEEVAWHFPMIVTCFPFGLAAFRAMWRLLSSGDDAARFGPLDTRSDLELLECFVWFGTYLGVDFVLIALHKMGDAETFFHHILFGSVCYVMFRGCTAPFVGAALIAQELSTPFLNSFLLLRGYRGLSSAITQLVFALFAVTFFVFRVGLNTLTTLLFLREFGRSIFGGSHLLYSPHEQAVLAVVLTGGMCLQLYWARAIVQKLSKAMAGGELSKAKAKYK